MKPVDVKDNTYVDPSKEANNKDPKFKVGDHVRISTQKKFFAKRYTPNWPEEVKNKFPWTYVITDLNSKEIQKELQKTDQQEFSIEKVVK